MPGPRNDRLSKAEIRKDALQDGVTAASHVVGTVATILTTAVSDVARAMGGFATEIFEIRDATRRAKQDHNLDRETDPHKVVVTEPAKPAKPAKRAKRAKAAKAAKPAKPVVSVVKDPETEAQPKDI